MTKDDGTPSIHCRFAPGQLPASGLPIAFEADEAMRSKVRDFLDVTEVLGFTADLLASPWRSDGARVSGTVEAALVQKSVVTLEPLERRIREAIDLTFLPQGSRHQENDGIDMAEIEIDPEADDPPETFRGGQVDLGPYLVEALALSIDPYPRESGAAPVDLDTDPEPQAGKVSPFAVLKDRAAGRGDKG